MNHKNMNRKTAFLCAVLAAVLILPSAFTGCAKKEESSSVVTTSPLPECNLLRTERSGDFTIAVYEEYSEITGYSGEGGRVTVPSEYGGQKIMSIGKAAFEGNTKITGVELPVSVVNIDTDAFRRCTELKTVIMPGVRSIGSSSFKESGITSAELPETLQNLGRYSFAGSAVESVSLPGSIVRSGEYVFSGCTKLQIVSFGEDFSEISTRMFSGCESLTGIAFTDDIEKIGDYAFAYCSAMKRVLIPDSVSIADGAFYGIDGLVLISGADSPAQRYAERYSVTFETSSVG